MNCFVFVHLNITQPLSSAESPTSVGEAPANGQINPAVFNASARVMPNPALINTRRRFLAPVGEKAESGVDAAAALNLAMSRREGLGDTNEFSDSNGAVIAAKPIGPFFEIDGGNHHEGATSKAITGLTLRPPPVNTNDDTPEAPSPFDAGAAAPVPEGKKSPSNFVGRLINAVQRQPGSTGELATPRDRTRSTMTLSQVSWYPAVLKI